MTGRTERTARATACAAGSDLGSATPTAVPEDERMARMGLSCVAEAGDPELAAEVGRLGAPEVWRQLRRARYGAAPAERAARLDLAPLRRQVDRGRFRFVVPGDPEWPDSLGDLAFCGTVQRRGGEPFGLWLSGPGRLDAWTARSSAVVGSRASTAYGDTVAGDLSLDLASAGVTVVSGGAFGIDAAAHRGAMAAAGGHTIAVLACGVDVAYPPGNAALFTAMARDHLIVSELPPGAHPTRVRFLSRNRLIAALTGGTVVVEAALRSGARNTASWASACGRVLMAVPGPVHSALSVAPHRLIRDQQAALVTTAADVVELISPVGSAESATSRAPADTAAAQEPNGRPTDRLEPVTLSVYEALAVGRHRPAGEVALLAGLAPGRCLAELATLAELGLAESDERGWRVARR